MKNTSFSYTKFVYNFLIEILSVKLCFSIEIIDKAVRRFLPILSFSNDFVLVLKTPVLFHCCQWNSY